MYITSLNLSQYRNFSSASIELHPKLTIFLGENGAGKTNILEAIHLLSFPRSFRNHKDEMLRQWNQDYCRIEGKVIIDSSPHSLVFFYDKSKKLQIDGQNLSASSFVGQFLSVLFAPEEVDLLAGSPGTRRAFLDAHLSLISPIYFSDLLYYNKAIKQRNRLLSNPRTTLTEMEYWNTLQIQHGVALLEQRVEAISKFNELLSPNLALKYTSSLLYEGDDVLTNFQKKQASIFDREKIVGHTLIGPHRDDWFLEELTPAVRNLGIYGSRGEQRMGVVTLKQAQLQLIHQATDQHAVLLLDDVLSELDANHQTELLSTLGNQQTILTTASLSDVPEELLNDALVYVVSPGSVSLRT